MHILIIENFYFKMSDNKFWALILGGTGGFGMAAAKILATKGFNLILVYRERKHKIDFFEKEFIELESQCKLIKFNLNAHEKENQKIILDALSANETVKGKVSFLLHAIADGNLRSLFKELDENTPALNTEDFNFTIRSLGTSLLEWTNLLMKHQLFSSKSSVLGLTSEGSYRVLPDYAAVAAAKSVMESNVRYMAVELATKGIRVNLINAGITDTQALKAFPDYNTFIHKAIQRNPHGRLTQPADVAKVIGFMASDDSEWISGNCITVDGGEQLISFY